MKIKITLFLFLLTFISYGQYQWTEGELVLKNGKTLKGQIKLPVINKYPFVINVKERVKYRKNRKSKKVKYDDKQVLKVIFRNSDNEIAIFEYVQTSKKAKGLFKIIRSGKATLYARKVYYSGPGKTRTPETLDPWISHGSDFNEFYVLRKNEKIASPLITARFSRSFKKRAMEYFSDCSSIVTKLTKKIYKDDDIIKVVDEYNQCK